MSKELSLSGLGITYGFALESPQPLDARAVVETRSELDDFKTAEVVYPGMLVYCKADKKYYTYKDENSSWEEFSGSAGSSGSSGGSLGDQTVLQIFEAATWAKEYDTSLEPYDVSSSGALWRTGSTGNWESFQIKKDYKYIISATDNSAVSGNTYMAMRTDYVVLIDHVPEETTGADDYAGQTYEPVEVNITGNYYESADYHYGTMTVIAPFDGYMFIQQSSIGLSSLDVVEVEASSSYYNTYNKVLIEGDLEVTGKVVAATDSQGLRYRLSDDGTYAICTGSGYCTDIVIASTYKGKPVTSISNSAFEYCDGPTNVVIPNSVESIGDRAFANCSKLTSILIPNSVESIGDQAFAGCSSLTIYCEAESKPGGWDSTWNFSDRPVIWDAVLDIPAINDKFEQLTEIGSNEKCGFESQDILNIHSAESSTITSYWPGVRPEFLGTSISWEHNDASSPYTQAIPVKAGYRYILSPSPETISLRKPAFASSTSDFVLTDYMPSEGEYENYNGSITTISPVYTPSKYDYEGGTAYGSYTFISPYTGYAFFEVWPSAFEAFIALESDPSNDSVTVSGNLEITGKLIVAGKDISAITPSAPAAGSIGNIHSYENGSIVLNEGSVDGAYAIAGGTANKALIESLAGEVAAALVNVQPAQANGDMSFAYGADTVTNTAGGVALGVATTAGAKGYYWHTIDKTNKTITLSSTRPTLLSPSCVSPSGIDWRAGDTVVLVTQSGMQQDYITEITAVKGNTITVKNVPPSNNYSSFLYTTPLDRTIYALRRESYISVAGETITRYVPCSGQIEIGAGSRAVGALNTATGLFANAEGGKTAATGKFSTARGYQTLASGLVSEASGMDTDALGEASHAEGSGTTASGQASHAEGHYTKATGLFAHAEGWSTTASGETSHAEGRTTTASLDASHAEGYYTIASELAAHAEGYETKASGLASHAEGVRTEASGDRSHTEGSDTKATSAYSHAEGNETEASGASSHAEGHGTKAQAQGAHAEGILTKASNTGAHAEGAYVVASGIHSHAEGDKTSETFSRSTSNGKTVTGDATGHYSHREGRDTSASGNGSHAEGYYTVAFGAYSHAEGSSTQALGEDSHTEGYNTLAQNIWSHAEGYQTKALHDAAHAEGRETKASGRFSHAEGAYTEAKAAHSHAAGYYTTADAEAQTVVGTFNSVDTNAMFVVGCGYQYTNEAGTKVTVNANCFTTGKDSSNKAYIEIGKTRITEEELGTLQSFPSGVTVSEKAEGKDYPNAVRNTDIITLGYLEDCFLNGSW